MYDHYNYAMQTNLGKLDLASNTETTNTLNINYSYEAEFSTSFKIWNYPKDKNS